MYIFILSTRETKPQSRNKIMFWFTQTLVLEVILNNFEDSHQWGMGMYKAVAKACFVSTRRWLCSGTLEGHPNQISYLFFPPTLLFQQRLNKIVLKLMYPQKLAFRNIYIMQESLQATHTHVFPSFFSRSLSNCLLAGQTYILCTGPYGLQSIFERGQHLGSNSHFVEAISCRFICKINNGKFWDVQNICLGWVESMEVEQFSKGIAMTRTRGSKKAIQFDTSTNAVLHKDRHGGIKDRLMGWKIGRGMVRETVRLVNHVIN